jgi:hypothetical protein
MDDANPDRLVLYLLLYPELVSVPQVSRPLTPQIHVVPQHDRLGLITNERPARFVFASLGRFVAALCCRLVVILYPILLPAFFSTHLAREPTSDLGNDYHTY